MRISSAIALLMAGLLLLTGCQNNLKITVQMVEPEGGVAGSELVPGASYADAVSDSIAALRRYATMVGQVESTLLAQGETPADVSAMLGDTPQTERRSAEALAQEGVALLESLTSSVVSSQNAARVREFTNRVCQFTEQQKNIWLGFARDFQAPRLRSIIGDAVEAAVGANATAQTAKSKVGGFGGFAVVGQHKISPGDPMYARVLKGKPIGEPFSAVDVGVSGDSTIMFVQETPTQMRIYRVDMDPRQLIQNVIYITDKALQAATKFYAPTE